MLLTDRQTRKKFSKNFPDTTWCEAGDEQAEDVCKGLGGILPEGLTGNSSGQEGWKAYLLSGQARAGDMFAGSGEDSGDNGDDTGDEPGTNTEPQTPPTPQCEGDQPANITASGSGATGTATCVNGKWVYEWSGGWTRNTYISNDEAYAYAGATLIGYGNYCSSKINTNGCAGITFSGELSRCSSSCTGSIFNGERSYCMGSTPYACAETIVSGNGSKCKGSGANACAGAEIQAGAYCVPEKANGCDGALYGPHPNKDPSLMGSCQDFSNNCPKGVPLTNPDKNWNETTQAYDITGWKGNCCNPAYMVSGQCPSDIAICE